MLDKQNTETRRIAMQIHTRYDSHIREYDNDVIERQCFIYVDNKSVYIIHYLTETITEISPINI